MKPKETEGLISSSDEKIVLANSDGFDEGELFDKVAQKLKKEGMYQMICLAMISSDNSEIINLHPLNL